jgi:hypothetical protein
MINRTFKFYGQAFSPTAAAITVKFNGVEIFSGPVSTINSAAPDSPTDTTGVMFEYVGTTDVVGNIPFELHVINGTVFFGAVAANYSGIRAERSDTGEISIIEHPENFWSDVNQNSIETDGKSNVSINGAAQIREVIDPTQIGDWWYRILEDETFTCNIFVDPNIIVTTIPE